MQQYVKCKYIQILAHIIIEHGIRQNCMAIYTSVHKYICKVYLKINSYIQ